MFRYLTCCVDSNGESINNMKEESEDVDFETFVAECESVAEWSESKGYEGLWEADTDGLSLEKDWSVGFFRSTFEGAPCLFIAWSGIEYIWTEDGHGEGFGYYTFKGV